MTLSAFCAFFLTAFTQYYDVIYILSETKNPKNTSSQVRGLKNQNGLKRTDNEEEWDGKWL